MMTERKDYKDSKKKGRKADGHGEHRKAWQETAATVDDIKAFLEDHVFLRHNVITKRVECRIPEADAFCLRNLGMKENWSPEWQPLSDRVVNSLWSALSRKKRVNVQDMYRVIESDFVEAYHPFRYYLDHLPPWDGQDYLMELSLSVSVKGEVEEQMRFAQYLKKWLVGMVAAWVDDAVVNNVILVLIGEQGSYKTTWFHYLLPPELRQYFYTKTNSGRMGRDDLLTLAQYGLVCCEELDTMRPSELNQLKAAVTMPSVDERAAYAHYHEHRQHIASFCGTGNNVQFLSDPTGNRRWLPFEVESIDSPRDRPLNYEGIYAQAYALYREGFQYWFSREEIVALAGHNRQFETPRLEDELVQQYFRVPAKGEPGEFVSVALALQIVGCNITQKLSTVALGRAFVNQGFARKTCRNVRGYVVVRRSAEEMQSARRLMAHECNTDTDDTDVF